jgi:cob(I)alamin adenosyltransferase
MIQFIKGPWKSGENYFADKFSPCGGSPKGRQILSLRGISQRETNSLPAGDLPQGEKFQIIPAGKGFVKILGDKLSFSEHKKAGQKALKLAQAAIKSKKWDLIILDEINVAVDLKLLKATDVLKIIRPRKSAPSPRKSAPVIILTGRNAPKSFIKAADLVTEMKEIKHPFKRGKLAKRGIDF